MSDYALIGAVCGSIFQIVLCVGFISGCVSLCCWCHKRCQRRRQPQNGVNVIYVPTPAPPEGYQPAIPNYYPAPVSPPNFGLPITSAPPPSYQEATSPGLYPLDVSQRPPMYTNPPLLDQNSQQPYNPEYCLPKYDHR